MGTSLSIKAFPASAPWKEGPRRDLKPLVRLEGGSDVESVDLEAVFLMFLAAIFFPRALCLVVEASPFPFVATEEETDVGLLLASLLELDSGTSPTVSSSALSWSSRARFLFAAASVATLLHLSMWVAVGSFMGIESGLDGVAIALRGAAVALEAIPAAFGTERGAFALGALEVLMLAEAIDSGSVNGGGLDGC